MAAPRTIHDFGRFPQALFDVRYPAPGDPALAARVAALLGPTPVRLDQEWGLDHGTWSVLVHAFPDADVPVIQLGMDGYLGAAGHFELARRLAPLRDEGVLIVGSGNVVHNLPAMNWNDRSGAGFDWATRFDDAMAAAILADQPGRVTNFAALGQDAALSVPTPEHFWPLLYTLAVRDEADEAVIETDVIEYGSLSMMSVVLRPTALD
jgi:4,5-DOPA dioxygenase extradiol